MGFFRPSKDLPKESSPKNANTTAGALTSKKSVARLQRLSELFTDDTEELTPCETSDSGNGAHVQMPILNITGDSSEQEKLHMKGLSHITFQSNPQKFDDVARKTPQGHKTPQGKAEMSPCNMQRSKSRREHLMDRASSIQFMTTRDSIKRSVSRKIIRSQSRMQNLSLGDNESRGTGSVSGGITPLSLSPRGLSGSNKSSPRQNRESLPLSRTSSLVKRQCEDGSTSDHSSRRVSLPKDDLFDRADMDDDIFLVEEATRNDFPVPAGKTKDADTAMRNRLGMPLVLDKPLQETGALEKIQSQRSPKKQKSKKPPPLLPMSTPDACDSNADSPQTSVFGHDGGFMTGGFKITSEGMVGKPDRATREDSDSEAEGEMPQSDRNLIIVRSLAEFKPGPTIGAGAGGRVYLAEHFPTRKTMAMKVVNVYDKAKRNQLLKELETLSTYVSRYLVRFYGAFYDGSGAVHIALEYMDHGCLATFVQKVGAIPEQIVRMIAMDCVRGLRFLHRNHVLHRDFKTANVLLSRRLCCAKLSDFGLARDMNPEVSRVDTFVGTVAYMSPERLEGCKYTYASDIWALGVSMVECLLGRYPFERPKNYFDYIDATMTANLWATCDKSGLEISRNARDFITLCTNTDPLKRPTASELLQHPWLVGVKKDTEIFGSWLDHCRIRSMQVSSRSPGGSRR